MCEGKAAVILSVGHGADRGDHPGHPCPLPRERAHVARVHRVPGRSRSPTARRCSGTSSTRAAAEASLVIVTGGLGPTDGRPDAGGGRGGCRGAAGVSPGGMGRPPGAIQGQEDLRHEPQAGHRAPRVHPHPQPERHGARVPGDRREGARCRPAGTARRSCVPCSPRASFPSSPRGSAAPRPADVLWATALMVPESNLEEALRGAGGAAGDVGHARGRGPHRLQPAGRLRGRPGGVFHGARCRRSARCGSAGERRAPPSCSPMRSWRRSTTLVTAESCTGGLIGKYMTDLPGSSRVYWGGFVSYANEAKTGLLGVEKGS